MAPKKGDPDHERWLEEIVSLEEAARLRGISIETIRSEIRRGALRAIQVSKKRLGMSRREALKRESSRI